METFFHFYLSLTDLTLLLLHITIMTYSLAVCVLKGLDDAHIVIPYLKARCFRTIIVESFLKTFVIHFTKIFLVWQFQEKKITIQIREIVI